VNVIDEVEEIIEETGGLTLCQSIASILEHLPPCSSRIEREDQEERATEEEINRYCAEVEAPAFAVLRERKASRPSAWRKEPVTFTRADAGYYREVLEGIDLHLPQLAAAPAVNSLTLRISWPPEHEMRCYPCSCFLSSSHENFLALYLGAYRPSLSRPGCYLVLDTWAKSVAVIPSLPIGWVTSESHCNTGTAGVAILRHDLGRNKYLLAELYLHRDDKSHLASNKASLFLWCSSGSGPFADHWIQKEVVLPIPADEDGEDTEQHTYSFQADMVFAISSSALCWVDLLSGILVCDNIRRFVTGSKGDDLVFTFIPLPEECALKPDPLFRWGRAPEGYRSMCCMSSDSIRFVSMDNHSHEHSISEVILRTWTLTFPLRNKLRNNWKWEKDSALCMENLFDTFPILKKDSKLQQLVLSRPIIYGLTHAVHLSVTDLEYMLEHQHWKVSAFYELQIDMDMQMVSSVFKLPSGSPIVPPSHIFASAVGHYMNSTELHPAKSTACEVQAAETEGVLDSMRKKVANFSTAFGVQAAEGEEADESMGKVSAKKCYDLPEGKYPPEFIATHMRLKQQHEKEECRKKYILQRDERKKMMSKERKKGRLSSKGGLSSKEGALSVTTTKASTQ